jgi:hypothetical protein
VLSAAGDEDDDESEDAADFGVHRRVRVRSQCFGALPLLETVLDTPPLGLMFTPLHCGPEECRKSPHTYSMVRRSVVLTSELCVRADFMGLSRTCYRKIAANICECSRAQESY